MRARNLIVICLLVVLSLFSSNAQEKTANKTSQLDPWDITEIQTFHSLLHALTSKYYQDENVDVLKEGYRQVSRAFVQLQEAKLPERFAGRKRAYQSFVATIEQAFERYTNALEAGDPKTIKEAFENVDEVFEAGIPLLRKRLNAATQEK